MACKVTSCGCCGRFGASIHTLTSYSNPIEPSGADDLRLLANNLFYDANDERDPHHSLAFAAPTAVADKRIRNIWGK